MPDSSESNPGNSRRPNRRSRAKFPLNVWCRYFIRKSKKRVRFDKTVAITLMAVILIETSSFAKSSSQPAIKHSPSHAVPNIDPNGKRLAEWLSSHGVNGLMLEQTRLLITDNDQATDTELDSRLAAFGVHLITHLDAFLSAPATFITELNANPQIVTRTMNELLANPGASATLVFDSTLLPAGALEVIEEFIVKFGPIPGLHIENQNILSSGMILAQGSGSGFAVAAVPLIIVVLSVVVVAICSYVAVRQCQEIKKEIRRCTKGLLGFLNCALALFVWVYCFIGWLRICFQFIMYVVMYIYDAITTGTLPPDPFKKISAKSFSAEEISADVASVITLGVTPEPCAILVSWPSVSGYDHFTSIRLYRQIGNGPLVLYQTFLTSVVSYLDNAVAPGTNYSYAISFVTSTGSEGTKTALATASPLPCSSIIPLPPCLSGVRNNLETIDSVFVNGNGSLADARIMGYSSNAVGVITGQFGLQYNAGTDTWACFLPDIPLPTPVCATFLKYSWFLTKGISIAANMQGVDDVWATGYATGAPSPSSQMDGAIWHLSGGSWGSPMYTPDPCELRGSNIPFAIGMIRGVPGPQTGWVSAISSNVVPYGMSHYDGIGWSSMTPFVNVGSSNAAGPTKISFPFGDANNGWFSDIAGTVGYLDTTTYPAPGQWVLPFLGSGMVFQSVHVKSAKNIWACGYGNPVLLPMIGHSAGAPVVPVAIFPPISSAPGVNGDPASMPILQDITFNEASASADKGVAVGGCLAGTPPGTSPIIYTTLNGGILWTYRSVVIPATYSNAFLLKVRFVSPSSAYAIGGAFDSATNQPVPLLVKIVL